MGKINFVKGQRPRQNNKGYKNIINPFDYGTDEYWNRRENLERFLNYTSDKVYWMWVNEEVNDSQAVAMAELESGEVFNPNTEYANGGMFGDGGEVAQKIKDKLAKGSFELPMEMIVYVPSTKDGNVIIPKGDFQARVKNVRAFLATKFGGFSSNPTDGGYMSNDNKGLIEEDVVKVTAFATKESLEENLSPLLKKIQYWCKAWSQESIGFEFEGDLFYISATSKFMSGGRTKFAGGGEAEDQDNRTMIMRQAKEVAHHVEELNEILSKQPDIDAWVVAKMQDVTTQLSEVTHYLDSRVGFRLGGDDIQKVQDSMLARGAKLDDTQSNIKNIKSQLEKYQGLAADYMHKKRNPTYSPYDKDIDRLQKDLAQKLEENNIYNFDTEDDLVVRTEKNRNISKEIQMAQSWLPRMRSPYRPSTYSYSKFVRSLITPMQKDVFQKLQKEYWQRAWNTKIKISPKKDTIEFEHYNKNKGNWYNMEEGGQTLASVQDSIMANGAKLENYMSRSKKWLSTIKKFPNLNEEYPQLMNMSDEEIITFVNTYSYYDRMEEGIEEEFDDINDAIEYLVLINE